MRRLKLELCSGTCLGMGLLGHRDNSVFSLVSPPQEQKGTILRSRFRIGLIASVILWTKSQTCDPSASQGGLPVHPERKCRIHNHI